MKKFVLTVSCFVLCAFAAFAVESGPLLVPDYNRDGKIDELDRGRLEKGEAFTIWLNDDDDDDGAGSGDKGDTNNDLHDVPGGNDDKDCEDETVNGRCDLLDFFPVLVNVEVVPGWDTMTWKLSSKSVNVVFTQLKADTAGSFHTTEVKALDGETPLYKAGIEKLVEGEAELLDGFLDVHGRGVILVEGAALGDEGLTLRGEKEGSDPVVVTLDLRVKNVEDMYRWMNLRPKHEDESRLGEPSARPDSESDGRHFVLVHGYNSNHKEARGNAAEFYKKLWQSGSDVMLTAVEWRGDQSQIEIPIVGLTVTPNYFVNVENAFLAARPFADACKKLPGEKILVGHSLGNMLIASAIRDYGLDYTKYVMLNAAVPCEAYDANAYDEDMVDDDWLDTTERPLLDRASRWYKNFAGKEYDPYEYRRKLAWRGRFANLPRTVNYYSPTDNILLNPDPHEPDPDEYPEDKVYLEYEKRLLGTKNQKTGFGFWSFSEKMKGTWVVDAINEVLTNLVGFAASNAMKCEAGWGTNENYKVKAEFDPANTRFTPFLDPRMKTKGMLDILPAETERLRAQHLADAIPSESFAAGANEVATLANVNMESFIDDTTDHRWPVYEGEEVRTNLWNHSAFREVAFYHTSKLYMSLAAVGKPRIIIDANVDGGKDTLFTIDLAERMIAADKLDVLAVMTNGVDEAMARYQELLDVASEKSVVICAIGSTDILTALLTSHAELVEKTVKELRVVDEATVPQGWPTKVVVTEARPAFYESKDILADFPAGTLSPAIRAAETNDPSGVQLVGPMAVLPLTEGEPITNQTAAAILNRLRAIYRTGNPALPDAVRCIKDAGIDYYGHDLTFKVPKFSLGAYSPNDVHMVFAFDDKSYVPDKVTYDPVLEVFSVHFTVPAADATAWNSYNAKLTITLENEKLGPTVIKEVPTQIVQGAIDYNNQEDWFREFELEVPTNYVPSVQMPERTKAIVETTFLFEYPSPETDEPPEGEVQAAVRVVADGEGGYKFQYYAFAGLADGYYYRKWHDFNVGGKNVQEIKPVIGNDYIVRMEGFYREDARGEANTLTISVKNAQDNMNLMPQFVGNLINTDGKLGGLTRLNSVGFAGEGTVESLFGNYCVNIINANLARIDDEGEYPTVTQAVAAADGEPIRLLHAASWKPTEDDLDEPVRFLNKSDLVLDLSGLPANARAVWTDVDGNNGTLALKLVSADTVVYGTIRTAEEGNPVAEALAIADGKYVYVGDASGVAAFIEDGFTEVIDHRGKGMVMPGCTDGHSHYIMKFGLANMKGGILFDLSDDKTNVLKKVEAAALTAQAAGKTCIFGFGWSIVALRVNGKLTLEELDKASHGLSTVIFAQGGHHAYCNTECLRRCGIIDDAGNVLIAKIDGGLLELDENGYPTGFVDERVTGYLTRMGGINPDELVDDEVAETSICASQELLLSTGYTIALEGWSNTLHPSNFYAAAHRMDTNGTLKLVFPMTYEVEPWQTNMTEQIDYLDSLNKTYGTEHVRPEYLKVFMDGCVESMTGAMIEPYTDEAHTVYKSFWSTNRLADITRECNAKGLTVHTHVMGDAAVKETADAYIQGGDGTHRNCMVHLRHVRKEDFQRFADNNIACSAGFTWHVADAKLDELLKNFLDEEYIKHAYPMKSFFDAGVKVSSHSDFPANEPSPQDPFGIMQVALTGLQPNPAEGDRQHDTNELVTVEQVFRALTINGAWQMGLENERGSIQVGKWADFVLADQDVFECSVTNIARTKVVSTWFEGEKVYQTPDGSEESPWLVGATNAADVVAWTNANGRLVIDGKGAIKDFDPSAPWAGGTVTECLVGSNVTVIGANAFAGCAALKTLVLYGQTPPILGAGNDLAGVKIFVAAGAADAYRVTSAWLAFAEQIDEMRSVKGEKIATHLYEMTYRWWDATYANDIAEILAVAAFMLDQPDDDDYFFPYQVFDWYREFIPNALCTSCRNGNFVGRNFDWGYDDVDECVMHVPAAEGRLESVGVASWFFPKWLQDLFNVDEFLPELTMDGVNEKGVAINVNVVPGGDNGWTEGTNPESDKRLCAGFAVRTVLDNATNAAHAVEILQSRDIYSLKPLEFHWMISDATESYIVECVSNALVVLKAHDARPKMSNYYVSHSPSVAEYDVLTNAELTAGFHTPHAMGIERYANVSNGLEQVNSAEAMFTHMTNVWYKPKYLPGNERKYWSDLNGAPIPEEYAQAKGDRFEFNDGLDKARSNAFKRIQENYVAVTNYEARHEGSRTIDHDECPWLTNGVVHTVHTSIYDIEKRELVVCVQEDVGTITLRYQDEPYAPVPVSPEGPATYGTQAMAEKAATRAVFTPTMEVEDKLGKGSEELATYCNMFGFAVVPTEGGKWSVKAALYPEDWTNVIESAQAATLQLPVADLAALGLGDVLNNVKLTNCVPGFFYSLYDGAAVTNIRAVQVEADLNVLCGTDKEVLFPNVTKPIGGQNSGFFSIGVLEVPDVLAGAETYHTITGFHANIPSHH